MAKPRIVLVLLMKGLFPGGNRGLDVAPQALTSSDANPSCFSNRSQTSLWVCVCAQAALLVTRRKEVFSSAAEPMSTYM